MDGEHIEMMIHGWASSELREKAIVELANMREELYILRQLASGLTKRPPDGLTPGQSEQVRQMIQNALDTGSA